jgi:hypothetical protein
MTPIEITQKKIEFVNNSYFVQISLLNASVSKIFLESAIFKSQYENVLKVNDLNSV